VQITRRLTQKNLLHLVLVFSAALALGHPVSSGASDPDKSLIGCDIEFAKMGRNSTLTPRTEIVAAYFNKTFTTPRENLKWMELAEKSEPSDGVLFGDVEFSVLQKVNTLTNDKNLVTSMTNKHKELTFEALDALQKKYAHDVSIITYSDFKSVRFAIAPLTKGDTLPPKIKKELEKKFDEINKEYAAFIRANDLDIDGDVDKWFRGGLGVTADEANFAARMSRDMGQGNPMRDFEDQEIRSNMATYQKWAEAMRQVDLAPDPEMKSLIENGFVKDDVLDIVKKNPIGSEARARLKAKYGANLDEVQIERLYVYNQIIDKFSPGIHVAERKVASLEGANNGGLSADFSGLGAKNRGATARALAEGLDLRDAIARARQNEKAVTKEFLADTRAFKRVIERYLASSTSSGDDFVGVAGKSLSRETKRKLVDDVAKLKNPSGQRISFIPKGVALGERNRLAAHGEAIEKVLRQELEGRVATSKLKNVVFAVDMFGKSAGAGDVELIIGEGRHAALTDAERLEIRKSFQRAVDVFNTTVERGQPNGNYRNRSER